MCCLGHSWKQGQWSKDEVALLQDNISTYCKVHCKLLHSLTEILYNSFNSII